MRLISRALSIGIIILIILGIAFSFNTILDSSHRDHEIITYTWIQTSNSTFRTSEYYQTYGLQNTLSNVGGRIPADIKTVTFKHTNDTLIILLDLEYEEGFARPYAYGVFLSDTLEKGKYCALFLPWFNNDPKVLLVDLKDFTYQEYQVSINELTAEVHLPLNSIERSFLDNDPLTFFAWASSWAHDFVPLNKIDDREDVWFFDDLAPLKISFTPRIYTTISIHTSVIVSESTQLKTALRVVQKPAFSWFDSIILPTIPWVIAGVLLGILWKKK